MCTYCPMSVCVCRTNMHGKYHLNVGYQANGKQLCCKMLYRIIISDSGYYNIYQEVG